MNTNLNVINTIEQTNDTDYRTPIHQMVDQIENPQQLKRLYSLTQYLYLKAGNVK